MAIPNISAHCYDHSTQYTLARDLASLREFPIRRTSDGYPVFKLKADAFSLHDCRALVNSEGIELYHVSNALFSLRHRMWIYNPQTKYPVACLRRLSFIPYLGAGTVHIWNGSKDEGLPCMMATGNLRKREYTIRSRKTEGVLATIREGIADAGNFSEKHCYYVQVEPGVDAALMVTLAIAIDEQYNNREWSSNMQQV